MSTDMAPRDRLQSLIGTLQSPQYKAQIAGSMGLSKDDPAVDRFTRVVTRAIQEDPKVLNADRNSLYLACLRAAQEGLMPDGKEGKLVIYNTKQGNDWIDKVQWQPMIGGIRKIAARHDFDLVAHVVFEHDDFEYEQGDTPSIHHKAPKLGTERGSIIGAYAIATHKDGRKYREVMDITEIMSIASKSKSKDREGNLVGPWKDFLGEQCRKTVAKRLSKSLPYFDDENYQRIVEHDNEEYDMGQDAPAPVTTAEVKEEPAAPARPSVRDRMGIPPEETTTTADDSEVF